MLSKSSRTVAKQQRDSTRHTCADSLHFLDLTTRSVRMWLRHSHILLRRLSMFLRSARRLGDGPKKWLLCGAWLGGSSLNSIQGVVVRYNLFRQRRRRPIVGRFLHVGTDLASRVNDNDDDDEWLISIIWIRKESEAFVRRWMEFGLRLGWRCGGGTASPGRFNVNALRVILSSCWGIISRMRTGFFSTANAGVNSWNFSWATCNNVNAKDSSGYDSMSPSFPSMEREWWQWKNVKRWVYILQHYSVTIFWSYETNPFNETSDRTKTPRGLLH